jgi:hypothetical protein
MRDTGRCAESVVAAVIRGRYEESVSAMEVIGRQEKSVVDMEATGCYANSLVAMQNKRSHWRSNGCCGKFVVAMKCQWVLWKSLVARKIQWLLCKFTCCYANSLVAMERLRLLWKVSGRWGKSVVVVVSH